MLSPEVQAALRRVQDAQDQLRKVLEIESSGEKPIAIKVAAHRFGLHQKTVQRLARRGAGVKIGGRLYIYPSALIVPEECKTGE